MRTLLFLLAAVTAIAHAEPTKEERELATRYNLPPETVKFQQEAAAAQPPKTLDEWLKDKDAGAAQASRTDYSRLTDEAAQGQAPAPTNKVLEKIIASVVATALLAFFVVAIRSKFWTWRPTKTTRIALVGAGFWCLVVQLWGYVFGWGNYFDEAQYIALHVSVPALCLAAWFGARWIKSA